MKNNPNMISTDTHQQFNRALKPAILKQYPAPILNNTTVSQLEAGNFPIEVFPPEVFFKGKLPARLMLLRCGAQSKLRGNRYSAQHHQKHAPVQVFQTKNFELPLRLRKHWQRRRRAISKAKRLVRSRHGR